MKKIWGIKPITKYYWGNKAEEWLGVNKHKRECKG